MARILIVEDDSTFAMLIESFVKKHGHTAVVAASVKQATQCLTDQAFDLLLLDYRLPDGTGMDVLTIAQQRRPGTPVVVMTSFNDVRTAVKLVRSGAFEYITKPVNPEELLMIIGEALQKDAALQSDMPAPRPASRTDYIAGDSEVAREVQQYIALVAPTNMSVIIQGESGTGKEQVARAIHQGSKRSTGPFVAIDCGALSAELAAGELFGHLKGAFTGALADKTGQFVAANGGTLFLDEVGNLNYEVQVKLLRALQEREVQPVGSNKKIQVDVRIITATNDDLLASVQNGQFREDLYHRLNEFKILLAPLYKRGADLHLFINHFIAQANTELHKEITGLAPDVKTLFEQYEWPGNLRELRNIVKRAVLLAKGPQITMDTLPAEMVAGARAERTAPTGPDLKLAQAQTEKELIMRTLEEVRYNKSKAARLLNIDRKTLYYKMDKYGIEG